MKKQDEEQPQTSRWSWITICVIVFLCFKWCDGCSDDEDYSYDSIKTSNYSSVTFYDDDDVADYLCKHKFVSKDGYVLTFKDKSSYKLMGENVVNVKVYVNGKIYSNSTTITCDNRLWGYGMITTIQNATAQIRICVDDSHYVIDASGDKYYEQ